MYCGDYVFKEIFFSTFYYQNYCSKHTLSLALLCSIIKEKKKKREKPIPRTAHTCDFHYIYQVDNTWPPLTVFYM